MPKQNDDDFEKDLDDAVTKMDAAVSAKLTLPSDLLKMICPSPVDQKALEALITAVNGAASDAEAKALLIQHAEDCGLVLVRLLKTVALA